ncbi:MAG: N-acetylmuramic acid 6-phosphate etherase [Planctomycetota bacterium]
MQDRGHFLTELRNPRSMRLDRMSVAEAFDLLNSEDATVAGAVADARADICQAIELVVAAFQSGGRLIYVGAGTSGRLGVLDAAECPPTFLSDPSMVQGVIAGGWDALHRAVEGAEDHPEHAAAAMDDLQVGENDVVFGISTGGSTPYVHGALQRAHQRGAKTVFFGCVTDDQFADEADVSIRVLVGPEVVTGSTRLKAGTATKMVLNMVTTLSMVRIGKVYENLMVDVNTRANAKLVDRGTRILQTVTGLDRAVARQLLERADGRVKTALVMYARGLERAEAERLLAEHDGQVSRILTAEPR